MIRPFTLITMILAALSGAYLFAVKHRAQVLDDELATTAQQSRLDAQRIRVLQAQWALEIDPTRLTQLATQFTTLQPMKPSQLVTLAALREALPPSGSAAPGSNPQAPVLVVPGIGSPNVTPGTVNEPNAEQNVGLPLPPPQAPGSLMVASVAAVARQPIHKYTHSALHIASTQLAESLPAPRPFYSQKAVHRSVPMGAQFMSVKASSVVSQPVLSAPPRLASDSSLSQEDGGSALGGAADLPPPQPLSQSGVGN